MKRSATALLCFSLLFSAACAAEGPLSPTDTYILARDRYIAAFKSLPDRGRGDSRATEAFAKVDRLLRAAVPAWSAPGFSANGVVNLNCLDDNAMGFSVQDGLVYRGRGTAEVIVTNRSLMKADVPSAFFDPDFWTFAVGCDAGAELRGQVPVKVPGPADLAIAELALFTQDIAATRDADTLLVGVVRGDRVFIARQDLAVAWKRPAACARIVDLILARSAAALKAYQDSLKGKPPGPVKDISKFSEHIALEDEAGRQYQACFARHLKESPSYSVAQRQAQALVDLLH